MALGTRGSSHGTTHGSKIPLLAFFFLSLYTMIYHMSRSENQV